VGEPTDLPEGIELELLRIDDMDDDERAALIASIERGLSPVGHLPTRSLSSSRSIRRRHHGRSTSFDRDQSGRQD
jgi:hypothetical protein